MAAWLFGMDGWPSIFISAVRRRVAGEPVNGAQCFGNTGQNWSQDLIFVAALAASACALRTRDWRFLRIRLFIGQNLMKVGEGAMSDVIVRDPEILGGRPVFRGTRVPVEVLFENLEDGLPIDEIIAPYPSLNKADLIACLEGARANLMADSH